MAEEFGYPIQRVPRGLTNVLGAVNALNPPTMEGRLSAHIDLLQFYGQAQLQDRSSAAAGGVGTSALLTVPANEWWIVYHCGVQWTTDATVTFAAFVLNFAGTPVKWQSFTNAAPIMWAASSRQVHMPHDFGYPKALAPGRTINGTLSDLAGTASLNFQVNALIGVFA